MKRSRLFCQAVAKTVKLRHQIDEIYTSLLLEAKGQVAMDGRERALGNVFTEHLWRTVKYEEVHLRNYATPCEGRTGLAHYFEFYNG